MPTLKQLECTIELCDDEKFTPFQEFGTTYGDGLVITHVLIPARSQPFSIRLTSNRFIADGLAALLFIDGEYQCNRNRTGLKPNKGVNFLFRQREDCLGDGKFLGRDWSFEKFNTIPRDETPQDTDFMHFKQIGTIQIVVTRCSNPPETNALGSPRGSFTDETIKDDNLSEAESAPACILKDTSNQCQTSPPPQYTAAMQPTVEEALDLEQMNLGDFGGIGGLFDGARDTPDEMHFGVGGAPSDYYGRHSGRYSDRYYNGLHWRNRDTPPLPLRRLDSPYYDYGYAPARRQMPPHERDPIYYAYPPSHWNDRYEGLWTHENNYSRPELERRNAFYRGPPRVPEPRHPYDRRYSSDGWRLGRPFEMHDYEKIRDDERLAPHIPPQEDLRNRGAYLNPTQDQWTSSRNQGQVHGSVGGNAPPNGVNSNGPGQWNPNHSTGQNDPGRNVAPTGWNPYSQMAMNQNQSQPGPQTGPPGSWNTPPQGAQPYDAPNVFGQPVPNQWSGGTQNNQLGGFASAPPGVPQNLPNNGAQTNQQGLSDKFQGAGTANQWDGAGSSNQQAQGNLQSSGHQNQWNTAEHGNGPAMASQGWASQNNGDNEANDAASNAPNDARWGRNDQDLPNNTWDNNQQSSGPPGSGITQNNDNQWGVSSPNDNPADVNNGDWSNNGAPRNSDGPQAFNPFHGDHPAGGSNVRGRGPLWGPKGMWYGPQYALEPKTEAEPVYDVPEEVADKIESRFQIRAGRGYMYSHKTRRPVYIDTMVEPYAVFTFKYLEKEVLERLLNIKVSTEEIVPGKPEERVAKLQELSKEDLIRMILKPQDSQSARASSPATVVEPVSEDSNYKALKANSAKFLDIPEGLNIQGLSFPQHIQGGSGAADQGGGEGWGGGHVGKGNNFDNPQDNSAGGGSWDNGQGGHSVNNDNNNQWASGDQQNQDSNDNWNNDGDDEYEEDGDNNQGDWGGNGDRKPSQDFHHGRSSANGTGGWNQHENQSQQTNNQGTNSWNQSQTQAPPQGYQAPLDQPQQPMARQFHSVQANHSGWQRPRPHGTPPPPPQGFGPPPPPQANSNHNFNWQPQNYGGAPPPAGNNPGWPMSNNSYNPALPSPLAAAPAPPPVGLSANPPGSWNGTQNITGNIPIPGHQYQHSGPSQPPPSQQRQQGPPAPCDPPRNFPDSDSTFSSRTREKAQEHAAQQGLLQNTGIGGGARPENQGGAGQYGPGGGRWNQGGDAGSGAWGPQGGNTYSQGPPPPPQQGGRNSGPAGGDPPPSSPAGGW